MDQGHLGLGLTDAHLVIGLSRVEPVEGDRLLLPGLVEPRHQGSLVGEVDDPAEDEALLGIRNPDFLHLGP